MAHLRSLLLLPLLLAVCLAPTTPAGAQNSPAPAPAPTNPSAAVDPVDAQIIVFASGGATSTLSIAYLAPVTDAEIQEDFRRLATQLRTAPVKPKIDRGAPSPGLPQTASANAELPNLIDWSAGVIHLDPVLAALKRFRHVRFDYLLFGRPFQLTWPVGDQARGPLHWRTVVRPLAGSSSIAYDVWIDRQALGSGDLPSTARSRISWPLIAGLVAGGVLLVGGLLAFVLINRRRHAEDAFGQEGQ